MCVVGGGWTFWFLAKKLLQWQLKGNIIFHITGGNLFAFFNMFWSGFVGWERGRLLLLEGKEPKKTCFPEVVSTNTVLDSKYVFP